MHNEKKYKYCSLEKNYMFSGAGLVTLGFSVTNDRVGRLRLIKMCPSILMYDLSAQQALDVSTVVRIEYVSGNGNEYEDRYMSVSGAIVGYPQLTYIYPYEQRDWVYPVIVEPGKAIEFNVWIYPVEALTNVRVYLYCTLIFEDV